MSLKVLSSIIALYKNDKFRKKIIAVLCIVLSPFALFIALLVGSADGVSQHNNAVVQAVFGQEELPDSAPLDFKIYIVAMQSCFKVIEENVTDVQKKIEEGSLDPIQVKSMFFAVYYGEEVPDISEEMIKKYVDCFVTYKTVDVPVVEDEETDKSSAETTEDEISGRDDTKKEATVTKEIAVPVDDLDQVVLNISTLAGKDISQEQINNYEKIYSIVNLGANASTTGDGSSMKVLLKDVIEASENKSYVGGEAGSPFEDDWRSKITSEFGTRFPVTLPDGTILSDPHTGMDLGKDVHLGTSIVAVNDGIVVYVRNHTKGLGLHLAIDHGGGILTVYGHTSRILVQEGEAVKKGQRIAEVGSTGYSTGPHLHLEYWLHGEVYNPREYLEKQ